MGETSLRRPDSTDGQLSPNAPISIETAWGSEAPGLLGSRWDDLVLRQRLPNPTLLSTCQRHLLSLARGTPCIVTATVGDRLVAAGAFEVPTALGRRGPRIAVWLGPGRLLNHPDIIVDERAENTRAAQAIMAAILDQAHGVYLGKAETTGPAARALRDLTPWHLVRPSVEGWVVSLPPTSHSHLVRKAQWAERRAQRLGAVVTVRISRTPSEVAPALERLFGLYRQRWRDRDDEIDRFARRKSQRSWYRAMLAEMAGTGTVRIVEVFEDDAPVASLLGLVAGRGALFHSTATSLGARIWGPGHRAMLAWAEEAHASGATTMDLGRGSGEPGSPKARLRPRRVPFAKIVAGSSPRLQLGVVLAGDAAVLLRDAPQRLRARVRTSVISR
jgi:hypothetical protein